jgi:transposase
LDLEFKLGDIFMTISDELEAQILRYFHVEKWRAGTIARQLHVHHGVVKRVLMQSGNATASQIMRPSCLDPYLPFILNTLSKYPKLTASRLYQMVVERGYTRRPDHFRHLIALHRPRPAAEAYFRLRTLPGEQAQVDWASFGYITIGKAKRSLVAFVMVLSYSRKIFLRFYLNQRTSNFLGGHEAAFYLWGGVPRTILYDNCKNVTLERHGDAIRFNPLLLSFAAHYRYEPRPVAVARGNEKEYVS